MQAGDERDKRRALKGAAKFKVRGDYAQASALLEEQIRRAPDVELLTAADELVFSGFRAGEFGAVLSLTRTLWSLLRAVQGDSPPIVERATTVMLFAERVGQDDLARKMADYVLQARRGYLPDRHPDLVLALNDAARLHLAVGDVDAARPLYEELAGGLPGKARRTAMRHPRGRRPTICWASCACASVKETQLMSTGPVHWPGQNTSPTADRCGSPRISASGSCCWPSPIRPEQRTILKEPTNKPA